MSAATVGSPLLKSGSGPGPRSRLCANSEANSGRPGSGRPKITDGLKMTKSIPLARRCSSASYLVHWYAEDASARGFAPLALISTKRPAPAALAASMTLRAPSRCTRSNVEPERLSSRMIPTRCTTASHPSSNPSRVAGWVGGHSWH